MGTWYKQPRKPVSVHYHDYPTNRCYEEIQKGDRYQCSCGQVFEIDAICQYNQDPTEDYIVWKRVYAHGVMKDTRIED